MGAHGSPQARATHDPQPGNEQDRVKSAGVEGCQRQRISTEMIGVLGNVTWLLPVWFCVCVYGKRRAQENKSREGKVSLSTHHVLSDTLNMCTGKVRQDIHQRTIISLKGYLNNLHMFSPHLQEEVTCMLNVCTPLVVYRDSAVCRDEHGSTNGTRKRTRMESTFFF